MSPFAVDKRDVQFCLYEFLDAEGLCKLPKYKEFNKELFDMVLDEAIKLSTDIIAPLNTILDREGVGFDKGKVTTPDACHKAYSAFREGGWVSPSGDQEYGGQGLPLLLNIAVTEIQGSASTAFLMTPGLTRAAGHVIEVHGTEVMKNLYLEKLYSGQWGGTMCLTESGAGSAVGDLKTKAKKEGDHYLIEGEKIFISSGDHDLTENIIHLVLARIEGAPKGMKGVSLFVVPKIRVKGDGSLGEPNNVACSNIEHKMGIKGSPTCTLVFGGAGGEPCHGYLLGEENKGILFMFQMMNEARIGVGLQGLGATSASYNEALQYARERIQGVDITEMKNVDAPRIPIIQHPDVRRMLLNMKAFSEGMRALVYFTAKCADLSVNAVDEEERTKNQNMLELLTPIVKGYCSEWGVRMTLVGIQVLGGYGYCQEYPQEQYCRDSVIATIYEGTNGIQALDLLGRKVSGKGGLLFMTFLMHMNDFINENKEHQNLGAYVEKLEKARDALSQVVMGFQKAGMEGDLYYPVLCATPFLEMFGHIVMSFMLLSQSIVADSKLQAIFKTKGASSDDDKKKLIGENPEARYYDGKLHSMRFFLDTYLPAAAGIGKSLQTGNRSALDITF
jgi:alkylation response protein AidB-like acyl-CoA dehydrogenase